MATCGNRAARTSSIMLRTAADVEAAVPNRVSWQIS